MGAEPRFIVHIGRQKTGTTAIQEFLMANRQMLDDHLSCYVPLSGTRPRGGHYHFGLGLMNIHKRMLASDKAELARWQDYADQLFMQEYRRLAREIRDKTSYILLSNEGFQNANVHLMANLFPPGQTQIVVYLREQLDYLVSAYAQAVHARKLSTPFGSWDGLRHADYSSFIERFLKRYKKADVHIRIYDRRKLDWGDVVKDFLAVLARLTRTSSPGEPPAGSMPTEDRNPENAGIPALAGGHPPPLRPTGVGHIGRYPSSDPNPSIGGALLEFKRIVNTITDLSEKELRLRLYRPISELASRYPRLRRKPRLEGDVCHRIRTFYEASNRVLFERYIDELDGFDMLDFTEFEPMDDDRSRDDLDLIWESLNETDRNFVQGHYERHRQFVAAGGNG